MRSPPPLHNEAELRAYDRQQAAQQYSYDLTARLTYFVVSAEMVVCGYILLNADKFGGVDFSRWLYLAGGLAALFGVLWRAFYNESFHAVVHGGSLKKYVSKLQNFFYSAYVGISLLFFVAMIWGGYSHLSNMAAPKPVDNLQVDTEFLSQPETTMPSPEQQRNKSMQPTPSAAAD